MALTWPRICDIVLYLESILFERIYQTSHNTSTPFSFGFCFMASNLIQMSLACILLYFCTIHVHNYVRSIGARFNLLNHSLALPLIFNLTILNNLLAFKFLTSTTIVNLSALSQPHFEGSVRSPLTLPKKGTWESSGTPENSERDCKGQNTLH